MEEVNSLILAWSFIAMILDSGSLTLFGHKHFMVALGEGLYSPNGRITCKQGAYHGSLISIQGAFHVKA